MLFGFFYCVFCFIVALVALLFWLFCCWLGVDFDFWLVVVVWLVCLGFDGLLLWARVRVG